MVTAAPALPRARTGRRAKVRRPFRFGFRAPGSRIDHNGRRAGLGPLSRFEELPRENRDPVPGGCGGAGGNGRFGRGRSAFIPRALALQFPYDRRLVLGMDYDFWLCIRAIARFQKLPFPVAIFELGGRSSTPAWEIHGLVMHRVLWHVHHRSRFGIHDLVVIVALALRFKLLFATRRVLGRNLSHVLRRTKSRWLQREQPATPSFA